MDSLSYKTVSANAATVNKEWNGLLASLYYDRWARWADVRLAQMRGCDAAVPLWYDVEAAWAADGGEYPSAPSGDCIDTAREVFAAAVAE